MRHSGTTTECSGQANPHPQSSHAMEQLQPGDACLECQGLGRSHKLRYFYISLEEQLLKCESRSCLWPHNDEVSSDEELEMQAPAPLESVSLPPSALESANLLPPLESNNLPPMEAAVGSENSPDDDDNFIMELLQQLTPATATDCGGAPPESTMNLSSMPDPRSLEAVEVKPCPALGLPDLSFLQENIPEHKESAKAVIANRGEPLPFKLRTPPKLQTTQTHRYKVKQEVAAPIKTSAGPSWQGKVEIPLVPASVKTSNSIKPKGDPFSTPPKKASTQPQTPSQSPPAVNIIISIPELNPAMPFLDAIKRHSAEPKPSARSGVRRPKQQARGTNGRGIRTQAVRHLIEHLEITKDVKHSSPRP
ncbi:uncharacterized protein LOC119550993 [Drosophila subpulchrella]|uniref:uncharacterized protein LOC119550993 n=1 Tax=Drosophila subpulchrella TaxID=1486046 RepID=UPI0018A1A4AB|nr:uncharacterized protein LOC119550993 [Drosophila subpulchrella]